MERFASLLGVVAFILVAWSISSNRRKFPWRVVIGGLILQFGLAILVLRTDVGRDTFQLLGDGVYKLLEFVQVGAGFMFNLNGAEIPRESLMASFAFKVLPTIIFFSAFMAVLYQIGMMQWVVWAMAWIMRVTLRTSGPETLSSAANVFVGHTEAPLVIKPYLLRMTRSELFALMTGGFANISVGIMGAYADMGIDPTHMLTASVISAPAALLIAKIMVPEEHPEELDDELKFSSEKPGANIIGAAVQGASDGLMLALNVGAMLIAFLALLALVDAVLQGTGSAVASAYAWMTGSETKVVIDLSLSTLLGYVFAPFAWLCGVPATDMLAAGKLIGLKTVANEFIAYDQLARTTVGDSGEISERTKVILTYALCGFANFGAVGIQVGGIGGLVPERKHELAQLGLRAMFGGTLSSLMTAAIAGIML